MAHFRGRCQVGCWQTSQGGDFQDSSTRQQCKTVVWDSSVRQQCETEVQDSSVRQQCETAVQESSTRQQCKRVAQEGSTWEAGRVEENGGERGWQEWGFEVKTDSIYILCACNQQFLQCRNIYNIIQYQIFGILDFVCIGWKVYALMIH